MVILPTALGKTVISALAAVYFLSNHWNMKILVMAPTRPLVLQHKYTFSKFLRIKAEDMVILTGKVLPSYRKHLWEGEAKVFFATPQVVRNDLESGRLSLENFSFVVFDECHRARKNYAYTLVAEKYVEQARWPVIMATTASPGSNHKNIHQTCSDLYVEQVEFRTEEDPDVAPYIYRVDVKWRQVDLPKEYREMGETLRSILWAYVELYTEICARERDLQPDQYVCEEVSTVKEAKQLIEGRLRIRQRNRWSSTLRKIK